MSRFNLFVSVLLVCVSTALGHTNITETIKTLNAQIKKSPTSDLYYQRATEYRALREKGHTIKDLRAALKLSPNHRPSIIALIGELEKSDEALSLAHQLAKHSQESNQATESSYLLAQIYHLRGNDHKSVSILKKIQSTTNRYPTTVDILLAECHLKLKQPTAAATVYRQAWKRTNSIVMRNQWIDASLTANQSKAVLPIIQTELSSSRFRSSWLIRRARAHLSSDKKDLARTDLQEALKEITPRINKLRPDLTLIADRGLIHALMGNPQLAKKDHAILKKSSLPPSSYRLLTNALLQK